MQFLKKHYEKIVLGVVLAGLIGQRGCPAHLRSGNRPECQPWTQWQLQAAGPQRPDRPQSALVLGQRPGIVEQRRSEKLAQRRRRREENQKQIFGPQKTYKTTTTPAGLVA